MTARELGRRASGIALVAVLVATSPCSRGASGTHSCPQERENARRLAASIETHWPLRGGGADADFVRAIGARLGKVAGSADASWRFVLVRDRRPNAFSIGDGRIYVSEGAIVAARTEAELAAMIAHEMGHQLAGHFCLDDGAPRRAHTAPRGMPTQHFDAQREIEADRWSVRLLREADYDPRAALTIARRVQMRDDAGNGPAWSEERRARLEALVIHSETPRTSESGEFERIRALVTQRWAAH